MSRDPLEELFGSYEDDDATAPIDTPVPAPAPAAAQYAPKQAPQPAPRQAQRPAQDQVQTRPVPARTKKKTPIVPWIIVGIVVLLALIGSLFVVNMVNNNDAKQDSTSETTSNDPASEAPSDSPSESPAEETPTETEEPATDEPPKVDVGADPIKMPVAPANISIETSRKFTGSVGWYVPAGFTDDRVMISSPFMNDFPDSCSAMRAPEMNSPWGIQKGADGKWTVVKPETKCADAPELYDEVWGLMQAVADSAKPL